MVVRCPQNSLFEGDDLPAFSIKSVANLHCTLWRTAGNSSRWHCILFIYLSIYLIYTKNTTLNSALGIHLFAFHKILPHLQVPSTSLHHPIMFQVLQARLSGYSKVSRFEFFRLRVEPLTRILRAWKVLEITQTSPMLSELTPTTKSMYKHHAACLSEVSSYDLSILAKCAALVYTNSIER